MRVRIGDLDLIDELHHQAARWLADHFDIILLSAFETSGMVLRGVRKLRAISVRSMLSYAHHRFQQFLGARGIFLRALGDTPALREVAQEHIGGCDDGIVGVS